MRFSGKFPMITRDLIKKDFLISLVKYRKISLLNNLDNDKNKTLMYRSYCAFKYIIKRKGYNELTFLKNIKFIYFI